MKILDQILLTFLLFSVFYSASFPKKKIQKTKNIKHVQTQMNDSHISPTLSKQNKTPRKIK